MQLRRLVCAFGVPLLALTCICGRMLWVFYKSRDDTLPARSADPPFPTDSDDNLFWFVQLSDIHVSRYTDGSRSSDLLRFCRDHIPVFNPALVIVTGDLTHSKTANEHFSEQYEDEWRSYWRALEESGVLKRQMPWLDLRGNHDAFDVPSLRHEFNLFRKYSVSGRLGRERGFAFRHSTPFGNYTFQSLDACPDPGLRRPFNFFGVLDETYLVTLKERLKTARHSNQTIWFGHYPSSIIIEPFRGAMSELMSGSLAYLTGHLHNLDGLLDHIYSQQYGGLLELEMADWKYLRRYRVVALDHDMLSFSDVTFNEWPVVVVTLPKDTTRFGVPSLEPLTRIEHSTHIRMLVFSTSPIAHVKVWVDDEWIGEASATSSSSPLYAVSWKPSLYKRGTHVLVVEATDTRGGRRTLTQDFSLDGSHLHFGFLQTFVLLTNFHVFFAGIFFALWSTYLLCLLLPWAQPQCVYPLKSSRKMTFAWLRHGLVLLGKCSWLFRSLLALHIYIMIGPWFAGNLLGNAVGVQFVHGLYVGRHFLPSGMAYFYGMVQVLFFHFPVLVYLAHTLHKNHAVREDNKPNQSRSLHGIPVTLLALFAFFWHGTTTFNIYRSYGLMAFLISPARLWALFLVVFLLLLCRSTRV